MKYQDIQAQFFEALRKDKKSVNLFLINGIKLQGKILNHDKYCIFLSTNNNSEQLIYKHAISTIVPI